MARSVRARLVYIAPSVLPSRSANAVHVVHQCEAFAQMGVAVTLIAKRAYADAEGLREDVCRSYGVTFDGVRLDTCHSRVNRGDNLHIALFALRRLWRRPRDTLLLSRNLYASYALGVLRRWPLLFETHQLETGFRKRLQRAVMTRPTVTTVVVSKKLRELLTAHHGVAPSDVRVLHDAAPADIVPLPPGEKERVRETLLPDVELAAGQPVCGYFGHLYPGRGIEIIEEMARARPEVSFLVFGGNETSIAARRAANRYRNLHYMGFVPHGVAPRLMAAMDVLLMPYQEKVSIGVRGHDTARWMSPIKMFEYLASGTPVISSDLPVLAEVLRDGENALLVPPADAASWLAALDRLTGDPALAQRLGEAGHQCYVREHTWVARAQRLLEAAGS